MILRRLFSQSATAQASRIELDMTSMIDIVFLLLVFFIMTFTITALEGDISVHMQAAAAQIEQPKQSEPRQLDPTIRIRLLAGPAGELAGIRLGERDLKDLDALHQEILALVEAHRKLGAPAEPLVAEFDCDHSLKYQRVISAITAVSKHQDPKTKETTPLIDKIKFAAPRISD